MPETKGSPRGERQYWIVAEARLEGPRVNAKLAAPGSDWMNVSSDGFLRPDVRLPFIADDGETVLLHYTGLVEHPPGLLRRAMNAHRSVQRCLIGCAMNISARCVVH